MQFRSRPYPWPVAIPASGGTVHTWIGLSVGLLVAASLPYWLPTTILALRARIFTRINGEEGIAIPGKLVDAAHFKQVYSHAAANGRSRGAALSDLFWYWLSPGPEMHQEHIESGGGANHPLCVSGAKQSGREEGEDGPVA